MNVTVAEALSEVFPLGCYVLYIFFSFCDGFNLKVIRKIFWALYFLLFSALSVWATGHFDLGVIIALSSLMAFVLAWFQKKEHQSRSKGL